MTNTSIASLGALGIASCLVLIHVAAQLAVRWQRVAILCVAVQGLVFQGAFWASALWVFRHFNAVDNFLLLYFAILASAAGMLWALVLLGVTLFSRRLPHG